MRRREERKKEGKKEKRKTENNTLSYIIARSPAQFTEASSQVAHLW
jgi:hypothetical protein